MKLIGTLLFLCISSSLFSQFGESIDTSQYASYRLSVRIANNRIKVDSNNAAAYIQRGYYLNLLRDHDGALRDIDKYLSLKPGEAMVYKSRAKVNFDKGDLPQAIVDISKAIELNPVFYDAIQDRSTLYYKVGNYEACKKDLAVLQQQNPNDISLILYLGYCETKLKNYSKAITYFDEILAKDSLRKEAYNNLGFCYYSLGDNTKALKNINKALQIDPRYPEGYDKRAQIWISTSDYKRALEDLNKALSFNPFLSTSLNNRAIVFMQLKQFNDALGDLNLLLDTVEPTPEILRMRAQVYKELGNTQAMEEDLKFAEVLEKLAH